MSADANQSFDASIIRTIRELANHRLQQLAKTTEKCVESYLLRNDHFCGVRFRAKFFQADWMIGDSAIRVLRGTNEIGRIEIVDQPGRRAA